MQVHGVSFEVVHLQKECYSEYASMKAYEDYIYGRWFYVYNDHQNLLQIGLDVNEYEEVSGKNYISL